MNWKRLCLIISIFMLCSCSLTLVNVEKKVYILDGENWIEITGSDLEGNTASQSADGKLSIPAIP